MSSIGTLYTTDALPHSNRIRATAKVAGLQIDEAKDYVHFETNKTPEFKAKFASGKVPAFETTDGLTLFEGSAIARYIASLAPNSGLLGTSPTDAALVDQWVSLVDSEIQGPGYTLYLVCTNSIPYNKQYETLLREKINHALTVCNTHLTHNTFLLPTNRISLADITLASVCQKAFEGTFGAKERAQYPSVVRHFETVVNQPALKDVFGTTNYAETGIQFVPPKKEKTK